jgi:homoserine trans-succinylase
MPQGYFDADTADALNALQEKAMRNRSEELLTEFPTNLVEQRLTNRWHSTAARFYGNWLTHLCALKERRLRERRSRNQSAREKEVVLSRRFAAGD